MSSASVRPSRYRLVEVIGKGGMGEVWLADDLMLERRVALKFLTASPPDIAAVDRLLGEARSAAALDHPFICKIYEVAELEHRPCIVMEYVAGETLERRLRRTASFPTRRRRWSCRPRCSSGFCSSTFRSS